MKNIAGNTKEDYQKLMKLLGWQDSDVDDTDYFNAWHFGLSEEDRGFATASSQKKDSL